MPRLQRSPAFATLMLAACAVAWPASARVETAPQTRTKPTAPQSQAPAPAVRDPEPPTTASTPASPANGFPEIKPAPFFRTVPKGETRTIAFFTSLFPDCTSQGSLVARVTSPPQHGSVTFEEGESFPRYATTAPLASCNAKKAPGLKMTYAAQEGYEGTDAYGVLLINPDGTAFALDVKLAIR